MGDLTEPTLNEQIGTLSGDTPLANQGALGEVTFDSSGPTSVGTGVLPVDPMQGLHMPTLKQNVTTTVSATGGQSGTPGDIPAAAGSGSTKGLIGFARKFLGVPYVWGGTNPSGFDCSGFVQYVYGHFGIKLPRISSDQARAGKRIGIGQLRAGDLVAWDNSSRNNGADHIAIYIGNGLIMEAPRPGRSVQISHLYDTNIAWGVRLDLSSLGGGSTAPRPITGSANKPRQY